MSAIDFVELATAAWLLVLAAIAVTRILQGRGHASLILTCVHFIFFGIPLWLDRLGDTVEITIYPGFLHALESDNVRLAYCGVVAVAPLIWQAVGGAAQWTLRPASGARPITVLEYVLLLLPVALAVMLFDLGTLGVYGSSALDTVGLQGAADDERALGASVVTFATLLAIAILGGILARNPRLNWFHRSFLFLAGFAALWLNGKRAIVVIAVLWLGYALWRRTYVPSLRTIQVGAVTVVILTGSLFAYQWYVRGVTVSDARTYADMRVDYGRDLVLRQALLPEVGDGEPPILDYRGQSFFFYSTLLVPRSLWPEKPWPFAVYQTSRMLDIAPRSIGWGITTSWLDECIANLGWPGVLFGPMVLGLVCRIGHRAQDPQNDAATVVVSVLLLTVQAGAFLPLIFVWLVRVVPMRQTMVERRHDESPQGVQLIHQAGLFLAAADASPHSDDFATNVVPLTLPRVGASE
jgi:hypothetical protein